MENIHYITYATHDEGTYKELINNNYNIKLITLGWNLKWICYKDKLKNIYKYILNLPDNDIIVFLDGFDTIINNFPNNLLENFKSYDCKILFSKDNKSSGEYITNKMFGNKNIIANSGMYMGYVKELKCFFKYILKKKGKDDQILINKYIDNFNYIKIDIDNKIFKNLNYYEIYFNKKVEQLFCQKPGILTLNRIYRAIYDNSQFYVKELLLISIIIIYLLNKCKLFDIIYILLIFLIYFFSFIDKSYMFEIIN